MGIMLGNIKPSEQTGVLITVSVCILGTLACSYLGNWKLEIVVASFGAFGQLAIAGGAYLVTRGQLLQSRSDAEREEKRHKDAMKAEADRFQIALDEGAKRHRLDLTESKIREDEKDRRIATLESGRERGQLLAKINLLDALCVLVFRSVNNDQAPSSTIVDRIIETSADLASRKRFSEAVDDLEALWQMADKFSSRNSRTSPHAFDKIRKRCIEALRAANNCELGRLGSASIVADDGA